MVSARALAARSRSFSVVAHESDRRSEWSASAPMAARTGLGSKVSDAQLDPECAATPRRSKPTTIASASMPAMPMQRTSGARKAGSEGP